MCRTGAFKEQKGGPGRTSGHDRVPTSCRRDGKSLAPGACVVGKELGVSEYKSWRVLEVASVSPCDSHRQESSPAAGGRTARLPLASGLLEGSRS